ncbi:MAG: hypothetical protein QOG01_2915 [Pseudonocardiales bacterium]|jgi:hypothetical protein|nr:hypothetical protein [Pseudonocardiales bacterium]
MRVRAILALAVASLWLVVVAPASSASAAAAYPPIPCPTLSVSTTTPLAGTSITVSGSNFTPNASVRLELHTQVDVLANVTTSNNGSFSVNVRLPAGVTGDHDIVAIGGTETGATGCPASETIVIHDVGGASTSAPGGNGGGTAFTGIDILALIAVAAVLLAAGVLLNRRGNSAKRAASRY